MPSYDSQFIALFENSSGYVRRHVAVAVEAVDYNDVETVALEKAKLGMRVDIMPELVVNDPVRAVIFPEIMGNQNPDLRIDDILWEVEGSRNSTNINNLKHAIDEGSRQANHVIVNLSNDIPYDLMFRVIKGRFKDHRNLDAVEFRYNGEYILFHK